MNGGADGIRLRGLQKRYGATVALAGLDLDVRPGEVLGVAGPNGAGKSTLVRIIAGEERADERRTCLQRPSLDASRGLASGRRRPSGAAALPQSYGRREYSRRARGRRSGWPKLGPADTKVMKAFGIDLDADTPLADCTLATQQRAEIARAVARDSQVFLFDEPNSALTDEESNELFREMHKLAAAGRIVLLVTHRLGDLFEHASRVAVIRDGRVRAILEGDTLTEEGIAQQLVVGRAAETNAKTGAAIDRHGRSLVSVGDWSHAAAFHDIALNAKPGEIIALVGVEGSGARELLRSFAGLESCSGAIEIAGETGERAHRLSAYVPATRMLSSTATSPSPRTCSFAWASRRLPVLGMALKKKRMRQLANEAIGRFLIRARSISQGIRSLSGGNQQKVAIAQALNCAPRLLLWKSRRGASIFTASARFTGCCATMSAPRTL